MSPAFGRRRIVPPPAGWVAVGAALLALGCSGGGDGDSDAMPCTTLSFDRALEAPTNGDVYLERSSSSCSTVDVGVVVTNLQGIFTVGFDISYPQNVLQYTSYTLGPLMQKDHPSNQPTVIANDMGGTIQVGITRWSPDPDVDAVGSEALIFLRFVKVASGAAAIDFDTSGGDAEVVVDDAGATSPATFAPGHGGMVTIP